VKERGPTIGRPRNRAWPLFALLAVAALGTIPPFKIQAQSTPPDMTRTAVKAAVELMQPIDWDNPNTSDVSRRFLTQAPAAARFFPTPVFDNSVRFSTPAPRTTGDLSIREDAMVEQTACPACGGFHSHADGPAFHDSMGCSDGGCIPGRATSNEPPHESASFVGAFLDSFYQCLCSPDPCYEPRWEPAANASFFADYARPRTVTRIRYDNLENLVRPDRNQFWIMQALPTKTNNTKTVRDLRARLQQVYLYQEAAGARGSLFVEIPYRQFNSSFLPTQAGFSDLNFGVKSMFFDCELLQLTFQFRTYTPTGNGSLALGTGHFSLDPSILASLKLGPDTYFQAQIGNWVPLAGNQSLAGGMFYWLTSVNQVLFYPRPNSPLIGTLEMDGWSFENGGYTGSIKPMGSPQFIEKGGGVSYFNIGPGLRQTICDRLDFGGAITWATGTAHWAQPWFRFELRFLF
jgi:hypothetical protein